MAITTEGHNEMKEWLEGTIKEGKAIVEGVTYTLPIFKTERSGDVISFYLYLDDTYSGTVSKFQLISKSGAVFDDQPDSIEKPTINGLLAVFKYTLTRV
jgi:hypothetical protein